MNIFDTLKYNKFYRNRFFGFDFSTESKIALINFINIPSKKDGAIEHHINQFVNTYGINYMLVGGGDNVFANVTIDNFNTFNFNGIKGLESWSDFNVLRTYINEMRTQYDIRYLIFRGICGGCWTALKVARTMKLESMLMFTPALSMDDLEDQGFRLDQVHGGEFKRAFKHSIADKSELDTFPLMVELKNRGLKIDVHWASRLDLPTLPPGEKLSDHYELHRTKKIEPKRNLRIHLHDLPPTYHTHVLHRYLNDSGKMHRMIREEVHLANIYLNAQANSSS